MRYRSTPKGNVLHTVTVRHNFETAHRLPHIGGKCRNIHGHSWNVEVSISGPLTEQGIVLDFGTLKKHLRAWIDDRLDHGAMLGWQDPLVPAFEGDGTKTFIFHPSDPLTTEMEWPTVENVALLIARVAHDLLATHHLPGSVTRVVVSETAVNTAEWRPM